MGRCVLYACMAPSRCALPILTCARKRPPTHRHTATVLCGCWLRWLCDGGVCFGLRSASMARHFDDARCMCRHVQIGRTRARKINCKKIQMIINIVGLQSLDVRNTLTLKRTHKKNTANMLACAPKVLYGFCII